MEVKLLKKGGTVGRLVFVSYLSEEYLQYKSYFRKMIFKQSTPDKPNSIKLNRPRQIS